MGNPYADDDDPTPEDIAARRAALGLDLPAIVTRPGKYITRSGNVAVVHTIRNPEHHDYNCVGTLIELFESEGVVGKLLKSRAPGMWTASGRWHAGGEHPNDIVK